nr:MAG TPA: hypothetical protein [Caudoviricetes sp.]DAP68997.1 MAG TPA: hypothetical protein [Caudoviricetes sp.]
MCSYVYNCRRTRYIAIKNIRKKKWKYGLSFNEGYKWRRPN